MTVLSNRLIGLSLFFVCAIVGGLVLSVGQATLDNRHCRTSGYNSTDFLAYCRSDKFADYEHGALYYGAEPSVGENIRRASLLFLGSSRTQAGFSSIAVRSYFNERNIKFFVMGFGYGEWSPFATAVIKRWNAKPKVVVINADPFFSEKMSDPAKEAIEGNWAYLWRLTLKMLFQRVHRVVCKLPLVCPESEPSIFRSARDGQWNWVNPYLGGERTVAIDPKLQTPLTAEELEKAKGAGEQFLQEIGLSRQCVVLTGTPNSNFDSPAIARTLADALGTSSIFPNVENIMTLDGGHLNLDSAERWSARFLELLSPILLKCGVS